MLKQGLINPIAGAIHAVPRSGVTPCATLLAAALAIGIASPAHAEFLNLGSTFQLAGTNAPNTFSETDTLTLGTTVVDGGALDLTLSTSAASGGGEWIVFTLQTTPGLLRIADNLAADWAMAINNVPIVTPAVLTGFYLDWGIDGTLTSPTSSAGGNMPIETNPVTGSGSVFGQGYSIDLTTAFGGNGAASPFETTLTTWGFDPAATTEFQMGFLLDPVSTPNQRAPCYCSEGSPRWA